MSLRWSVLFVALVIIAGCAKAPDLAGIGGAYNIIAPDRDLAVALRAGKTPKYWHAKGELIPGGLSVSEAQRLPGLHIRAGTSEYWFARQINASLLATPFLSWSWFSHPPIRGPHPVQMVVGFANTGSPKKSPWWAIMSSDFPKADRIVAIEWAETALGRGTVIGPLKNKDGYSYARYIARGGPEHGNRWWNDNADLALLHRQLWPEHPVQYTEVRFIGIRSNASNDPSDMYLSNLRLFR